MKIIRISADGLKLFNDKVEIDFFADQKVFSNNNNMLYNIHSGIYSNNVISFVGINASGKTAVLRVLSLALSILCGESINRNSNKLILLGSKDVNFEIVFFSEEFGLCKLASRIISKRNNKLEEMFVFSKETLWRKSKTSFRSKKDLFIFDDKDTFRTRDKISDYLKEDISISYSVSKDDNFVCYDLLDLNNINMLNSIDRFPREIIAYLDPGIESIELDHKTQEIVVKFRGRDYVRVSNPRALTNILSSGTIKGLNVFICAIIVLKNGGYLLIDELENHFNREIVSTLINFFNNPRVNINGSTLIFSTHYVELLDDFKRADNIFILRNNGGISVQKLSAIMKRNDIKKSEAFKSDFLNGTAPSYDNYIALKEAIISGKIMSDVAVG